MDLLPKTNLILADISAIFSETAVRCVSDFLGTEGNIDEEWEVVERLKAAYDYILTMGGASSKYQSILAIGVENSTFKGFGFEKIEEFLDMLGEFANTFYALLMDKDEFTSHFGFLNQSIPVLYSQGIPFLPFISGIQGKVRSGNNHLFIGFAIQELRNK